ncbi:MAG: sensor histidine kinase [Alkaliphilus sp.]
MSKIAKKLIFSYFLVLLIAFVATGVSFSIFSNIHLLRETRQQLRKEASFMATLLKPMPLDSNTIAQRIRRNHSIRLAGRLFESEIIILDSNRKLVFQNVESFELREFRNILTTSTPREKGFLIERAEIISADNQLKGYVFLLIKIENITSLNVLMRNTLFTSFLIAGLISLLIGSLFGRRIAKPISHLNDTMLNFSLNNSSDPVEINTKDEISELGQTFNQMIKKIHNLDEEQKRFLQNTSHELKTPLMSIQGYAEAIKDGIVTGDKVNSSLDIIIEESQRLKKTVDEIIYLTKLENVSEKFSFENKDLATVVEKVIVSVQSLASDKNIYIKSEVKENTIVNIDENKIIRVLINILGNAIRYANELIIINTVSTSKHIELFIIDDGDGFEVGVEKKIFERFYKGKDGSTGLGLTICRTILSKHNGSISAYNKSPHGAVFKIVLPLTTN